MYLQCIYLYLRYQMQTRTSKKYNLLRFTDIFTLDGQSYDLVFQCFGDIFMFSQYLDISRFLFTDTYFTNIFKLSQYFYIWPIFLYFAIISVFSRYFYIFPIFLYFPDISIFFRYFYIFPMFLYFAKISISCRYFYICRNFSSADNLFDRYFNAYVYVLPIFLRICLYLAYIFISKFMS